MNPTCPKCGAEPWFPNEYNCGSVGTPNGLIQSVPCKFREERRNLETQRDALLLENTARRKATKAAWDEGWDSTQCGYTHAEAEREWSRSEAKRIHDSVPFSTPSPTTPTSPADAAISAK